MSTNDIARIRWQLKDADKQSAKALAMSKSAALCREAAEDSETMDLLLCAAEALDEAAERNARRAIAVVVEARDIAPLFDAE